MLFTSLSTAVTVFLSLSSSVSAVPVVTRATNLNTLAGILPQSDLPKPDGLELKYVLLGIGTQNYTCTTGNATAAPGTTGAVAKLYDLGTRLNADPMAQWKINTISGLALSLSTYGNWLDSYLKLEGYNEWLGNHFFTKADATTNYPTFSLNKVKATPYPLAMVSKKDAFDAPKTSCPGAKNEGAVPWLRLVDDKNLSVGGVNTVYRLETAGGKSPATCKGQKESFEVSYAAQYWVYGPKA
ncbi:hypothetical protein P280DRAFT_214664 [Massarina eburnea CBS 473.64]|uniref:Malate dehydrogenase n=1 Tax=Massarina eburnea CBS 473.64 TaxID=1395130 RepID=A0A6A6SBZ6_9PLEO|nr:hypothetical protein P280DRAFT_214664 [Massarina eburnea CBS 473.64]